MIRKILFALVLCCSCCMAVTLTAVSVTSNPGSASSSQFTAVASADPVANYIGDVIFYIGATPGPGGCMVQMNWATSTVYLYDDAGNATNHALFGSHAVLSNSHCTVPLDGATYQATSTTLSFIAQVTFSSNYVGTQSVWEWVGPAGSGISSTGWQYKGTFNVTSAFGPPTITMLSGGGTTAGSLPFTFQVYDAAGINDYLLSWISIRSTEGWSAGFANTCTVQFRADGRIGLLSDDGNTYTYIYPSAVLSNSQCTVSNQSIVSGGNTATYGLTIAANAAMSGFRYIVGLAQNNAMAYTGPTTLGNWTIPAGGGQVRKGDSVVTQNISDSFPQYGIDELTGNSMLMPTTLHPLPVVQFASGGIDWPDTLPQNTPYTVYIRHAKPNTQIWLMKIISQHLNAPEPCTSAPTVADCDIDNYPVLPNGGLLGTTDGAGNFTYNGVTEAMGGTLGLHFWAVNSSMPPVTPATFENDDISGQNFVGGALVFITGQYNVKAPVPFTQ